jgi:LacI family transcriptional regulator
MGVAQYGSDCHGWKYIVPPAERNREVRLPKGWHGDGIICRVTSDVLRQQILDSGIPAVNVSWLSQHTLQIPSVISCEASCGQMAIDFLREKQFTKFGYIGPHPALHYSDCIESTLRSRLAASGHALHVFDYPENVSANEGIDADSLTSWLGQFDKPIAIVVWSSKTGHELTLACQSSGLRVPEDVSIICIEHDPLFSALAPVPLTNLDQDPWRVGFTAAKLLHEMIEGEQPPPESILIPPISVVPRISTEATAVTDPVLLQAVRFIYEHATKGITVDAVVSHCGVSRRALETRFRAQLQCSPKIFIRRIQLQSVARMLRTTKLSIAKIARRVGFEYPEVMMRSFKKEYNMTPMEFRGRGSVG